MNTTMPTDSNTQDSLNLELQDEYDNSPELQALLAQATRSPTVQRYR